MTNKDVENLDFGPNEDNDEEEYSGLQRAVKIVCDEYLLKKNRLADSFNILKDKKLKLRERISKRQALIQEKPRIIRFTAGLQFSISKSAIENFPDCLFYTLLTSKKFNPDENGLYKLSIPSEIMKELCNYMRNPQSDDPMLNKTLRYYGFGDDICSLNSCLQIDKRDDMFQKSPKLKSNQVLQEINNQTRLLETNHEERKKQKQLLEKLTFEDEFNLSIGGQVFSISKEVLKKNSADTYFQPLIEGNWNIENNTHFIDRNFDNFGMIHHFLIVGKVDDTIMNFYSNLSGSKQKEFISELDFYQLNTMMDTLLKSFVPRWTNFEDDCIDLTVPKRTTQNISPFLTATRDNNNVFTRIPRRQNNVFVAPPPRRPPQRRPPARIPPAPVHNARNVEQFVLRDPYVPPRPPLRLDQIFTDSESESGSDSDSNSDSYW